MGNSAPTKELDDLLQRYPRKPEKALKKLAKLCGDGKLRSQLIQHGQVERLLRYCERDKDRTDESNYQIAKYTSRTLCYLSGTPQVAAALVADPNGIKALTNLCRYHDDAILLNVVQILRNIFLNAEIVKDALDKGFLKAVIHLLGKEDSPQIRVTALLVLKNLSGNELARIQMAAGDTTRTLINILKKSVSHDAVLQTIELLSHLARKQRENRVEIVMRGGLEALSSVIFRRAGNHFEEQELQYAAAVAICNVAGQDEEFHLAVKDRCGELPFVSLLQSRNAKFIKAAGRGLKILLPRTEDVLRFVHSQSVANLVVMLNLEGEDEDVMKHFLHHLSDLAAKSWECAKCKKTILQYRMHCSTCPTDYCCDCYRKYSYDLHAHTLEMTQADYVTDFLNDGGVCLLTKITRTYLAKKDLEPVGLAAAILARMTDKDLVRDMLVDAQYTNKEGDTLLTVVKEIISADCGSEWFPNIQQSCVSIVANLSKVAANRRAIVDCGIVDGLLPMTLSSLMKLQLPAIRALIDLCQVTDETGIPRICNTVEGITTIMTIAYSENHYVRSDVMRIFVRMSELEDPRVSQCLVDAGAMERIFYNLTHWFNSDMRETLETEEHIAENCFLALKYLRTFDNAGRLKSDEFLDLLMGILLSGNSDYNLVAVLGNLFLAIFQTAPKKLCAPSYIDCIDKCARHQMESNRTIAAQLLERLSTPEYLFAEQKELCAKILDTLSYLASQKGDLQATRATAACLSNLAAQQPLKRLFNQQAINVAINLAAHTDPQVQLSAVRCLKNLTVNGPLSVAAVLVGDTVETNTFILKCKKDEDVRLLSCKRDITMELLVKLLTDEYRVQPSLLSIRVGVPQAKEGGDAFDWVTVSTPLSFETSKEAFFQYCKASGFSRCEEPPLDILLTEVVGIRASASNLPAHPLSPQIPPSTSTSSCSKRRFKWKRGDFLGRGAFGTVVQGLDADTGELMAVKLIDVARNGKKLIEISVVMQEIEMLDNLHHENIVQYYGTNQEGDQLQIFMQYVPGGSIASLLRKYGCFSEAIVKVYLKQILSGLAYLHRNGIVHRDIKGANILVTDKGVIKLADFGASKRITPLGAWDDPKDAATNKSLQGTPAYMAPEVVKSRIFSEKSDIWSIGVTVHEMFTGTHPYSDMSNALAIMWAVINSSPPEMPRGVSDDAQDFLRQCFKRKPEDRPTAEELLNHPFVQNQPNPNETGGEELATPIESFCGLVTANTIRTMDTEGTTLTEDATARCTICFDEFKNYFDLTAHMDIAHPQRPRLERGEVCADLLAVLPVTVKVNDYHYSSSRSRSVKNVEVSTSSNMRSVDANSGSFSILPPPPQVHLEALWAPPIENPSPNRESPTSSNSHIEYLRDHEGMLSASQRKFRWAEVVLSSVEDGSPTNVEGSEQLQPAPLPEAPEQAQSSQQSLKSQPPLPHADTSDSETDSESEPSPPANKSMVYSIYADDNENSLESSLTLSDAPTLEDSPNLKEKASPSPPYPPSL